MKILIYIYSLVGLLFLFGCNKPENLLPPEPEVPTENTNHVPEGYFVATFSSTLPGSRTPVTGPDTRVQHIRYLVYQASGEFVHERVILTPGTTPTWPITSIKDTLPNGSYIAVFMANAQDSLFPFPTSASTVGYSDILQNYTQTYQNARLYLPNTEFKTNTEYYWAKINFSNANPTPTVLLQRIISMLQVHRNFVDATDALDRLVGNIVTQINYENLIQTTVQGLLPAQIKTLLQNTPGVNILLPALGGLDTVTNRLSRALIEPVVDTLYQRFLKQLTHSIGTMLAGNEDQSTALGIIGELLNPWESSQAQTALVTIKDFPKAIDFNLNIQEKYTGLHTFRFNFPDVGVYDQKSLSIKGFSGLFDIERINVIKRGLISGLVFDGIVDGPLVINGSFIDITDPLIYTPPTNKRYKANYSFLDLGLKDYTQQTQGNTPLTVTVKLGEIGNIDNLLNGIPLLGGVVSLILTPLKLIQISLPLNLPLLSIDNLELSGGWSPLTEY